MIGFLYAICTLVAFFSFIWGIGSAMMNGTRYSSLGPCLLVAVLFGMAAAALVPS